MQDENFKDLQVTDKDFLEDHDFDVEEDLSNGDPFQIMMISDVTDICAVQVKVN